MHIKQSNGSVKAFELRRCILDYSTLLKLRLLTTNNMIPSILYLVCSVSVYFFLLLFTSIFFFILFISFCARFRIFLPDVFVADVVVAVGFADSDYCSIYFRRSLRTLYFALALSECSPMQEYFDSWAYIVHGFLCMRFRIKFRMHVDMKHEIDESNEIKEKKRKEEKKHENLLFVFVSEEGKGYEWDCKHTFWREREKKLTKQKRRTSSRSMRFQFEECKNQSLQTECLWRKWQWLSLRSMHNSLLMSIKNDKKENRNAWKDRNEKKAKKKKLEMKTKNYNSDCIQFYIGRMVFAVDVVFVVFCVALFLIYALGTLQDVRCLFFVVVAVVHIVLVVSHRKRKPFWWIRDRSKWKYPDVDSQWNESIVSKQKENAKARQIEK